MLLETYLELLTFINFAEKFTLGLIEIEFEVEKTLLIQQLKLDNRCQDIDFFLVNIQENNLRFLKDKLLQELNRYRIKKNKKLVLIIKGLENNIKELEKYPAILQNLNFVRDAYKKDIPHPILFILPKYAITSLATFAPDFWAWRSGLFK